MKTQGEENRGPKEIPFPFSLLLIPLLLIGGVLSIPVGLAIYVYHRRKERILQKNCKPLDA